MRDIPYNISLPNILERLDVHLMIVDNTNGILGLHYKAAFQLILGQLPNESVFKNIEIFQNVWRT